MVRSLLPLVWCALGPVTVLLAQAPGLPLVETATSTGARFFLEGDVQWATPRLSGNFEPRQLDRTFIPQINFGWNISDAQAAIIGYRYVNSQVGEVFNANVPDLESVVDRSVNLQTFDLLYRERMGGPDAPFGMDVDMGFRIAWGDIENATNALTIAGPVYSQQQLDFVTGGTRIGIRPYWTFDPSGWRMTLYAQGHIAYLWGSFNAQSWVDQAPVISARDYSTMWNWDAEAGFSMFVPGMEGVLQLTAGYRYEVWSVDRLGFMTSSDTGSLTMYGPFLRLQLSF